MKYLDIKIKTKSKKEFIEKIIEQYITTKNIHLSKTQISVLCFFIMYGINEDTFELILKGKLVKSKNQITNFIHTFRTEGLIKYKRNSKPNKFICEELNISEYKEFGIIIKFDNN